jgi:Acetyltransferase (GNAT) domain
VAEGCVRALLRNATSRTELHCLSRSLSTRSGSYVHLIGGVVVQMAVSSFLNQYEEYILAARERFANSIGISILRSKQQPQFFLSFLLRFCALGVRMTGPVEGWIQRAADRCREIGLGEMSRALARHARAEAGHDLMMKEDVEALAEHWNRRYRPSVDPVMLMTENISAGVLRYRKLHEDVIAGPVPYCQVAIEYEIERLAPWFGGTFIATCVEVLGPEILSCLSFVTSHLKLDVSHTSFNASEIAEVGRKFPESAPILAAAGAAALEAYLEYLNDCVRLAQRDSRHVQAVAIPRQKPSSLEWLLYLPVAKAVRNWDGDAAPAWLDEVRALRAFVLFDNGRRPAFGDTKGGSLDSDPTDPFSYHILVYYSGTLVGCSRVYPLASGLPCLAEAVLGSQAFSAMLSSLGVPRGKTAEIGRWIVHPDYRGRGRIAMQLAAGAAAVAARLGSVTPAEPGTVICCAGTGDGQHVMLRRIGLQDAPHVKPIQSRRYEDQLHLMYCIDPTKLDPRFSRLMSQMEETLHLSRFRDTLAASIAGCKIAFSDSDSDSE